MNVNDGTEPCPTCHSGVPYGTIKLHAEINKLRAKLEDLERTAQCAEDMRDTSDALAAHYKDGLESIEGDWPCNENHREMARQCLASAPTLPIGTLPEKTNAG